MSGDETSEFPKPPLPPTQPSPAQLGSSEHDESPHDTSGAYRVSFTVGTKLLLSVAVLILLIIAFLSFSAITLLTEDKQAYTYETKSTEAMLTGREFANTVGHVLDTLRISLSAVDPVAPITGNETQVLDSVIQNQSDVALVTIALLDTKSGTLTPKTSAINTNASETNKTVLNQEFLLKELTPDWIKTTSADISADGLGFVNLSRSDNGAMMAVIFADLQHLSPQGGTPVAIGLVLLGKMLTDLNGLNLTVVTRSGWTIFDTDPALLYKRINIADDPLLAASKSSPFKTGTNEYQLENKHYLGGFYKPGYDLAVLTRAEWDKTMVATYALSEKILLLGCMAIGLSVIFVIFFSKSLTAPINSLYLATKEVGAGNFDIDLHASSKDEIGALTESFTTMSGKIRHLLVESVEKAILEKEIDVAATVQKTLIPGASFDDPRVEIRSHYQAASRCGGDWWGFFIERDKMVFGVADATGHGVPAALISAAAHSGFSVLHKLATESAGFDLSPGRMLTIMNSAIYESSKGSILMTYFLGVIDFSKQTITYSNAAHNPPWLFSVEGGKSKVHSLMPSQQHLGSQPNLDALEEKTLPIKNNDILFFYTDGLTEGKSTDDSMFGKKKTRQLVESQVARGPDAIISTLMDSFTEFNHGKPLDDDVTAVAVKIKNLRGPG